MNTRWSRKTITSFATFVIVGLLIALNSVAQNRTEHPLTDARALAQKGEYAKAIMAFDRVRKTQPNSITPLDGDQFGAVYAHARDWEGVQKHARWMFDKFPLPQRIEDAERTAKGYLTYPNSTNEKLATHALELTTFAAENAEGEWVNWFYTAHALALYRNGKFEESIQWTMKTKTDTDPKLVSFALPIEAMSQYELGNTVAAEQLLRKGEEKFAKLPKPGSRKFANSWSDILTSQSVLEEAKILIFPKK